MNNDEPTPWQAICLQAVRGRPLKDLARTYGVRVAAIRKHLAEPSMPFVITARPQTREGVRSFPQYTLASRKARDDLITFLENAIKELLASNKTTEELMPQFVALTACASKLFGWQTANARANLQLPDENSAVNLNLIATPPEQLVERAIAQGLLPPMPPDEDQNNDRPASDSTAR